MKRILFYSIMLIEHICFTSQQNPLIATSLHEIVDKLREHRVAVYYSDQGKVPAESGVRVVTSSDRFAIPAGYVLPCRVFWVSKQLEQSVLDFYVKKHSTTSYHTMESTSEYDFKMFYLDERYAGKMLNPAESHDDMI